MLYISYYCVSLNILKPIVMMTVSNFPKPNSKQVDALELFLSQNSSFSTNYKWGFHSDGTAIVEIESTYGGRYNMHLNTKGINTHSTEI